MMPIMANEIGGSMNMKLPRMNPALRLQAVGCGLLVLFWLAPEDTSVLPAALLGIASSFTLLLTQVASKLGGTQVSGAALLAGCVLFGMGVGAGAAVGTALLMFFKNALHAHTFLDFPPEVIVAMLARTPVWALAGALIGLGGAAACRIMDHGKIVR